MADNTATEGSIRSYLAEHGGSVEDAGGRGLTDQMARALGVDKPATLSALLGQMESDGIITRDMRGLRTYRIALVEAGGGATIAPELPPAVAGNGADALGAPPPPAGRPRSSVRMPRSAEPSSVRPPSAEPPPAEPPPGEPPPAAGRTLSLRQAIARQTMTAVPAEADSPPVPAVAAPAAEASPAAPDVPVAPADASPAPPAAAPSMNLRQALAASRGAVETDEAKQADEADEAEEGTDATATMPFARPGSRFAGARPSSPRVATAAPAAPFTPPAAPPPPTTSQPVVTEPVPKAPKGSRMRSRLTVPIPEVRTPPSRGIITAVALALAGLVIVVVITIFVARAQSHPPITINQLQPSPDACNIVTPAMATATFGDDAGPANFVLGECVYQDATHELLVQDYHQDANQVYVATHTGSVLAVLGIGDQAYYVNGSLWVLKGTSILEITLGPTPSPTPAPAVLSLARLAVGRL